MDMPETWELNPTTSDERETTITLNDGDDLVRIWTNRYKDVRAFGKDERFTLVKYDREGFYFTIPEKQWHVVRGAKRRSTMSEEQRRAAAERLEKARNAQKTL